MVARKYDNRNIEVLHDWLPPVLGVERKFDSRTPLCKVQVTYADGPFSVGAAYTHGRRRHDGVVKSQSTVVRQRVRFV